MYQKFVWSENSDIDTKKWEAVIHWNVKLYDMFIICYFMSPSYWHPKIGSLNLLCFLLLGRHSNLFQQSTNDKCDWKKSFYWKITEKKTHIYKKQVLYIYTCLRGRGGGQTTRKTYATNFTYIAHWPPTKRANYNKIKWSKRWTHKYKATKISACPHKRCEDNWTTGHHPIPNWIMLFGIEVTTEACWLVSPDF